MTEPPFRSGFVCIVGRPNVGKSTLLNQLVGHPVSITTPKPQTTRNRILGVRHGAGYQAVLLDTPGIHQAADLLNTRMVAYAVAAFREADLVLAMVEPFPERFEEPGPQDRMVLDMVQGSRTPALLLVNKIDLAPESRVLATIQWYGDWGRFTELVPLSALKGRGIDTLDRLIPANLPVGPAYFEPDQITDQPEATLVAELVRQSVFRRTGQEIPYSVAVRVEHMAEKKGLLTVHAKLYVERDSQKGILIGKKGRTLSAIGTAARLRIESLLGVRVFLDLHVAVLKNWSADPRYLTRLGYPDR